MFEGLEKSLTKALVAVERVNPRSYSQQLATSLNYRRNLPPPSQQPPPPGGDRGNPVAVKLIVKPTDPNTFSASDVRKLMKEKIDPKTLHVGINRMKELANNTLLVECESKSDREVLQKELSKVD